MSAGRRLPRPRTAPILLTASIITCAIYLLRARGLFGLGLPLDDAWIHQTYARNLVERGEWAFQANEPSAGSTSPLWSAVLAVGRLLSIDPLAWAYLLGCALLALTAYRMAQWVGQRQPRAVHWSAVAGLLVVLEWHLVWASLSGMEILAAGLLALITLQEAERGRLHPFWLGILIGVGTWLRPEALLLVLPVGWALAWRGARHPVLLLRQVAAAGLGLAALLVGYGFFNWSISGNWLPNTWYAKSAEYAILRQIPILVRLAAQLGIPGAAMGHPELASGGPLVGPLALLLPALARAIRGGLRRQGPASLAPLIWVLAHLAAYAFRLPATYQHGRYAMPVIPVLLVLGTEGLMGWCEPASRILVRRVVSRAWLLSVGLVTVVFWVVGGRAYAQDVAIIESEMVSAARWVARNTEPQALVAAHDIGALGYFGGRRVLDLAGLVSPEVIGILRDEDALAELLDRRQADYLVSFPGWYPQLTRDLVQVFNTHGRFSPSAGGENLAVFSWPPPTIAPSNPGMLYSRRPHQAGHLMNPVSVIIVDDHPLFREGVRNILAAEADIDVVAESTSGDQAIELIREKQPMVALIDVNLPTLNGIQVTRQLVSDRVSTAVVLLTAYDDVEQVLHAFKAGAAAYCSKDVEPGKLIDVVRHVARGFFVVGDQVYDQAGLDQWLSRGVEAVRKPHLEGDVEAFTPLSPREMEILQYVTRGLSNKEIAGQLGISHQTVKNHMTAILHKLDVEDRTQAAVYALRHGWVRLQDTRKQAS